MTRSGVIGHSLINLALVGDEERMRVLQKTPAGGICLRSDHGLSFSFGCHRVAQQAGAAAGRTHVRSTHTVPSKNRSSHTWTTSPSRRGTFPSIVHPSRVRTGLLRNPVAPKTEVQALIRMQGNAARPGRKVPPVKMPVLPQACCGALNVCFVRGSLAAGSVAYASGSFYLEGREVYGEAGR
jgi:hypothetical protein